MPKELIHDEHQYSGDHPNQECVTEVRWSREGEHVQIATTLIEMADHSPVERKVQGGWYVTLNRRTINDLIRHLRRARDQAFGRDE